MKIITLTEEQFDEYAKKHKYKNYHQSSNYGKLIKTEGYDYHFLGFTNNLNELIGVSLIIYKKVLLGYKYAYAPYGFLFDYTNNDLIEELTDKLKKLLLKQNFIYLKINPLIHCTERDKTGKIVSYNPEINDILEILNKNGYEHHGFNKYFETQKPRWTAITKLTLANDKIYKNLNKQTRNKINKANKMGIEIELVENSKDNLKILYEFIKKKHNKTQKYYKNLLEKFDGQVEIYFAKISPEKYVRNSQELYQEELIVNDFLNQKLQKNNSNSTRVTKIINDKMESDKRLGIHQTNLAKSTSVFQTNPEGIIIGGCIIIKYDSGANLIIEGFDKKYQDFNPNYLLKWEIIKKLNSEGFNYFDLNGIVGEFVENNKYTGLNEMKLGFAANAIEYIGEFDLIINRAIFNIYKKKLDKRGKRI